MKPKIVFFDIDGTLLNHDKQLPETTIKAVYQLQDKGIITAIATGRAPFMHHTIRNQLRIQSAISYNGQYVVYEGKEIFKNPIPLSALNDLHELGQTHLNPMTFMGSEGMGATHEEHPFIQRSFSSLKQPFPIYAPDYYKENEIYQALLFFEKGLRPTYLDSHHLFDTIVWHEHAADVLPKGGSKAEGIKSVLNVLEIDPSEVVAFGDGLNDIDMLKYVGQGIAMGNAVQEAKEAARDVTADVSEDGIFLGLKKLGLIS